MAHGGDEVDEQVGDEVGQAADGAVGAQEQSGGQEVLEAGDNGEVGIITELSQHPHRQHRTQTGLAAIVLPLGVGIECFRLGAPQRCDLGVHRGDDRDQPASHRYQRRSSRGRWVRASRTSPNSREHHRDLLDHAASPPSISGGGPCGPAAGSRTQPAGGRGTEVPSREWARGAAGPTVLADHHADGAHG